MGEGKIHRTWDTLGMNGVTAWSCLAKCEEVRSERSKEVALGSTVSNIFPRQGSKNIHNPTCSDVASTLWDGLIVGSDLKYVRGCQGKRTN